MDRKRNGYRLLLLLLHEIVGVTTVTQAAILLPHHQALAEGAGAVIKYSCSMDNLPDWSTTQKRKWTNIVSVLHIIYPLFYNSEMLRSHKLLFSAYDAFENFEKKLFLNIKSSVQLGYVWEGKIHIYLFVDWFFLVGLTINLINKRYIILT